MNPVMGGLFMALFIHHIKIILEYPVGLTEITSWIMVFKLLKPYWHAHPSIGLQCVLPTLDG